MDSLISAATGLLHSNQFLQGGVLLGALTWVFYQIKAVPSYLFRKFRYWASYTVHFDEKTDFYRQFTRWFNAKYPEKFRNVEVMLRLEDGEEDSIRTPRRDWQLKFFQYTDTNFLWYGNRILWVTKSREKLEAAADAAEAYRNSYAISGLFARKAINTMCEEVFQQRLDEINQRGMRVAIRNRWDSGWDVRVSPLYKGFDQLFFEDKQKVIDDLNQFVERKEFYQERHINYKRCYLFYGPGGTGKTSVAAAIAAHLGHDLYVVNLANIGSNQALLQLTGEIPPKSTVVMEDIDCVLQHRGTKNEKLNFSTVLNFLDGATAPTDCVMVMTTNHPEVLDDALVRKGRVDFSLKIDFPRPEDASEFMTKFYGEDVKVGGTKRLSIPMSEVQEICIQNTPEDAVKLVRSTKAKSFKAKA